MKDRFLAVTNALRNALEENVFPCANLEIGNSKGTLFQFSEGQRQVMPLHLQVNKDTLFDMASVTKIMATTMVTLILVENGLLALSDKMEQFYDNIPQTSRDITVKHLLTHTSGIPGGYSIVGCNKKNIDLGILSLPPALSYIQTANVSFRLIERVTGKSLDRLAQDMVFGPLSMRSTSFFPKGSNIAATTWDSTAVGTTNDYNARYLEVPVGNAGLFSNLSDCSTFSRMLLNGGSIDSIRILSQQTISIATTNHTLAMNEGRCLGFYKFNKGSRIVGELFSQDAFGHTGWTGASIAVEPRLDLYVVLLTNRTHMQKYNQENIWRARRLIHNSVISSLNK